jgi:hypothetical protein
MAWAGRIIPNVGIAAAPAAIATPKAKDSLDQCVERAKVLDASQALLEALVREHGEQGRPDLILNEREIRAEVDRRLHHRRVQATRSR